MTALLPEGITHMADMPHTIHDAISAGLQFVSFDELPKEDQPPRKIWWDPDQMRSWWATVERRHEEKYGSGDKAAPGTHEERNPLVKELMV